VNADLWVGSLTTLAGALLGGVISYVLSRQQILEARRRNQEEWKLQSEQGSRDRRFSCYSDFITQARAYRGAVGFLPPGPVSETRAEHLDELAAAADATSSLVFLVLESSATYEACRSVLKAMRACQRLAHQPASPDPSVALELEDRLAVSLREFQVVAREELGVVGVERSRILGSGPGQLAAAQGEPSSA
jgi:hypothetical protein